MYVQEYGNASLINGILWKVKGQLMRYLPAHSWSDDYTSWNWDVAWGM